MVGQMIHLIKCPWTMSLLDRVAKEQNGSFDKVSFRSCVTGLLSVYNMFWLNDFKLYCNSTLNNFDSTTVLPAKSDSDIMFCLQSYQGLRIDRSLVY